MTTWQEWRNKQRYRLTQQRLDIANDLRLIHQVALFDNLQTIIDPLPKGTIGFYWPVRGEIDCRDFICGLIEQGWQAALPKIIGTKEALEFRQWRPESIMQAEVWDIPVPQNTAIVEPDVLIIPLVGFDTNLHRLGNGGGFYDRTLAKPVNRSVLVLVSNGCCSTALKLSHMMCRWIELLQKKKSFHKTFCFAFGLFRITTKTSGVFLSVSPIGLKYLDVSHKLHSSLP